MSKEKISPEDMNAALKRIAVAPEMETACKDADLVVECVLEDVDLKKKASGTLAKCTRPDTILGSNTSAIPITEIASGIDRADKVIGIHFMNPVPVMEGAEIIRGQVTSNETIATGLTYVKKTG